MKTSRALATLSVSAVILASCGGGGSTTVAGDSSTTTPGAEETTTTKLSAAPSATGTDPAQDAKAKAAGLQAADFPAGWEEQPPEEGLYLDLLWGDITKCLNVGTGKPTGVATSPTFLRDLATQARSTVEYTDAATAQGLEAAVKGDKYQQCLEDGFTADSKRSAPPGGTPGPVAVTTRQVDQLGKRIYANRMTMSMNLGEMQVPITQDLLVAFDQGKIVRLSFLNPGGEFPPELAKTLTGNVIGRV